MLDVKEGKKNLESCLSHIREKLVMEPCNDHERLIWTLEELLFQIVSDRVIPHLICMQSVNSSAVGAGNKLRPPNNKDD